jgi:hypothetical protein
MAKKVSDLVFQATRDKAMIGRMIDDLHTRNAAIMKDTHIVAVCCVLHLVYEKDATCDPANQLCEVFQDDKRMNSLLKWFETLGPFRYVKKEGAGKLTIDKKRIDGFRSQPEAKLTKKLTNGVPFWKLDPPKPYKGFDPVKLLSGIYNRGETILEDEELASDPKTKIDAKFWSWFKSALATEPWHNATVKA